MLAPKETAAFRLRHDAPSLGSGKSECHHLNLGATFSMRSLMEFRTSSLGIWPP